MHLNFILSNIDWALPTLAYNVMTQGNDTGSRNGHTMELNMVSVTLENPLEREITLHGRKANIAAQIAETAWVLAGRNDIEWLSHYLPRAKDFSDNGETWQGGYGPRLRAWESLQTKITDGKEVHGIFRTDQLAHVVELLTNDPLSRRAVMAIYDPAVDSVRPGKDVPCNDFIMFSNRLGKLDMHVTVRSNDLIWGFSGINAFEWSVLQEIVAWMVGVEVGALHFSTASLHVYSHHFDRASKLADARDDSSLSHVEAKYPDEESTVRPTPRFELPGGRSRKGVQRLDYVLDQWFYLEERIRTGVITDAEIDNFSEPMLQSWLRVLRWWWTGDHGHLKPLSGTRLEYATHVALQPKRKGTVTRVRSPKRDEVPAISGFMHFVTNLHNEKHAAYGDSWKRRGERVAIQANIARKVDRLGGAETSDETSADTAIDLMVYLAKYRTWLGDFELAGKSDDPKYANDILLDLDQKATWPVDTDNPEYVRMLKGDFERLFSMADGPSPQKDHLLLVMTNTVYYLARSLWEDEQTKKAQTTPAGMPWDDDLYAPNHDCT